MLFVSVRFKEKDATVRYLPGKVGLTQILKRYDDTPFDVTPSGPIVSVARTKTATLRGWTKREKPTKTPRAKSAPISVHVEIVPTKGTRIAPAARLSLSDPPATGLSLRDAFRNTKAAGKPAAAHSVATIVESSALKAGETTVPVGYRVTTLDAAKRSQSATGTFDVVLRTLPSAPAANAVAGTGVALIGGALELRLGHLCNQRGCAEHLHKSLAAIPGVAGMRPHPSRKDPRATVFLRAGQPVDLWSLREKLRDRGVEAVGFVPRQLASYRLRVELLRWRADAKSKLETQCPTCRDNLREVIAKLAWAKEVKVVGGGINVQVSKANVDLVELLNAVAENGTAPRAVWLVPQGVPLPKNSPARIELHGEDKPGGSTAHPVIEFALGQSADIDSHALALLGKQRWLSRAQAESEGDGTLARASIQDRKYANITPLLHEFRSAGAIPKQIRLTEFGDIRIRIDFAHVCGEVDYSKPPKPRRPKKNSKTKAKKPAKAKRPAKPKKPFVPKALRPAKSSNGRKAIEAAVNSVSWIKGGVFHAYHTRPAFNGPLRLTLAMQAKGKDSVRLDELISALRRAGFPPKSVTVSRSFPGIPFGKLLPRDLKVTDHEGKQQTLWSLRQSNRPFAVAFVSLNCKHRKHKKYKADPKFFERFAKTVSRYKNRVNFVAVSANKDDKFPDVVKFWEKTGVNLPLLHDADGQVRQVFNAQATPPPHIFVFDADGRLRYAGDPHDAWENPKKGKVDYLAKALELVLARKFLANGAVFYDKSVCNCSHPKCKCPKCGCGATCRCGIKHCSVGF